jgi:hypothetical protein
MLALKNPSLVVLDSASYHNVKKEDTVCPNFSQKKNVLAFVHTSFVIFPKAAYVSSLASFNRKVVLFLATKPLTCAHINSIGLSSHHNVKKEDTVCPNFSQKKNVLQNYLTQHNIPFSATEPSIKP